MTSIAVRATDIALSYGGQLAISESSFTVPEGGITAVVGPNGSGKSTILNAISGLLRPITGSLVLTPIGNRERRIAYVLQMTKVNDALPVTVREIVKMGRYSAQGGRFRMQPQDLVAVDKAMATMAISDLASEHLSELSGGQRQRVFMAQGLAQDHDLLLLDEPLAGLDLASARAIDRVIHNERASGCTVVMTTHDLAEARVADHVILLSGRVVAVGTPASVLSMEHLTAAYGPNLLHIDNKQLLLDDPAHTPVPGRHVHLKRSIHVEPSVTEQHGGEAL